MVMEQLGIILRLRIVMKRNLSGRKFQGGIWSKSKTEINSRTKERVKVIFLWDGKDGTI